jgi:hypothetical protein
MTDLKTANIRPLVRVAVLGKYLIEFFIIAISTSLRQQLHSKKLLAVPNLLNLESSVIGISLVSHYNLTFRGSPESDLPIIHIHGVGIISDNKASLYESC